MADNWKRQLDQLHAGLVRRGDPAELVTETDALEASYRYPNLAVRGPVFGLAAREAAAGSVWRMVKPLVDGTPQQTRDGLNSLLWFRARDDTDDPAVRRELLDAVAVLERERIDELEVLGTRYRVVRGDEFARVGEDGLEPPRPTDREPLERDWDLWSHDGLADAGFVLDAEREETSVVVGALRMGLRGLSYVGERFPAQVSEDSLRAVAAYPEVVLLPVAFGVAERAGRGWRPHGALMPTPHDARRLLYDAMRETWPMMYEFEPELKAAYARAAEEFRAAGRGHEVRVDGEVYRICRIERLVRVGPDGPESPRPSDVEAEEPMKLHPTMDEHGVLRDDEE